MRVRVTCRYVPGIGLYGAEKDIDSVSARTLIMLRKVERVVVAEAAPTPPVDAVVTPKPRRNYKRRDMAAEPLESTPVVAAALPAAPAPWDAPEE